MPRLELPTVTLVAAASVNVLATAVALTKCLDQARFADCILFTDQLFDDLDQRIRVVQVPCLDSARAYSHFVIRDLAHHIATSRCLVVQWDGFVIEPACWRDEFLQFDYIGAPWPQFDDGHDVGNGGFSLRSRKLLLACTDPDFQLFHPEDVAICRLNRTLLEERHGIRFAPREAAALFSFERSRPGSSTFGFHGIFNIATVAGPDEFWEIYQQLDDRTTALVDYVRLMRQLGGASDSGWRRLQLTIDAVKALLRRR